MNAHPRRILLIGGGRWGRVHASNLAGLLGSQDHLVWASNHNRAALPDYVNILPPGSPQLTVSNVDTALDCGASAAIVVSAADTHASLATACLERDMHVLVEKPLALTSGDARAMIALAAARQRLLAVGLHLLSASYLTHFSALIRDRSLVAIEIDWLDPAEELRYGERKRADIGVSKAHDLYPHIWAILSKLTGKREFTVGDVAWKSGGLVQIDIAVAGVKATAHLSRRAERRVRMISVGFADGGSASLDATVEPGTVVIDGAVRESDPHWGAASRPLLNEVRGFFSAIESGSSDWPQLAHHCLDSVAGAERVAAALSHDQVSALEDRISRHAAKFDDPDTGELVLDLVAPLLARRGVRLAEASGDILSAIANAALTEFTICKPSSVAAILADEDFASALENAVARLRR